MSDMCVDRLRRRRGLLLQTLLCWTLIGLCSASHRPRERGERSRFTRHHDRWTQRIQFPTLQDQGAQRIEYPSLNDEGTQRVRYPSVHDGGQRLSDPSVSDSAGSQVQKCAPGFYRDGSGAFLGRCVPCDCNGLAEECEDGTGRCLNCQYNTAGYQCERCKDGYYGNAAQRSCRVCPCPGTTAANSFATGCKEDVFGDLECVCRAGYRGERCESCAPGYYGNPMAPGGGCRLCNCIGNGNTCDPRTGVCKNTLEPGDTNTDEQCQECDNCAQTLLHDMEKLDDELERIKTQLDNATASSSSQDKLKKLEKAVSDTKTLVNKFGTAINTQKSRVNQLEDDVGTLEDDIGALKDKADKATVDADKAVLDVGKTHKKAKDLDTEIQNMLKKIQALLDKLKESGSSGDTAPNENLDKILEAAQRLVKEMEDRNFTPQKTAAEKERNEAKKLLDHIRNNLSKQSEQNEAAAGKLRENLKDYETKLTDLDEALKDADDLLKRAKFQNVLSAKALADLQKRIEALKKERKQVEGQIKKAEDELQKAKNLEKALSNSKKEYEELAAQMDGAKTDLTKKVNDIATAAAQEPLVEAAEKHAKTLERLAKELEDAVKNASGRSEVRTARDAIDAYKNITDAVNAAEAAADEARDAADKAFTDVKNQKLAERANTLKNRSEDRLNEAKETQSNLEGTRDDINNVKKRLADAGKKKTALQKDLQDIRNKFNDIESVDEVRKTLDEAKRKASAANDSANETEQKLKAIKNEMDKIKVTPVDSNLGNVLADVNNTVNTLLKNIPSLNDKISEVENLTSQFSSLTNISDNITRIKELIAQARDAANRIGIPMYFAGDTRVELRTPKDLDDLKAYTAMSLGLQRPSVRGDGRRRRRQAENQDDMFVLYLGSKDSSKNYIGMALEENILYTVYKLNGVEYKMKTGSITRSTKDLSKFDRVDLHRIYQDAKVVLTKDHLNQLKVGEPFEATNQGQESKNLLDLSPSDVVFYVGGYPKNFTPPESLRHPSYKGCIEFASFNDKSISLYNYQHAEGLNISDESRNPCKRHVTRLDSDYYEGTGYSRVTINRVSSAIVIDMSVLTRSENGLLFFVSSEDNYFTVTMEKGFVFVRSNLLQEPVVGSDKVFPVTEMKDILIVITNKGKITVRVGPNNINNNNSLSAQIPFNTIEIKDFYVGGVPRDLRAKHKITIQPYKGCLKNLKQNKNFVPPAEQVGISAGCPKDSLVPRKAEFSLGSSLKSDLARVSLDNDVTVSLGFKTTENEGLILDERKLDNGLKLELVGGHVLVNFNGKQWRSNNMYQDGQWHYLTMTRRGERISLVIDDEDQGQEVEGSNVISGTSGTLFLGQNQFKGCVSNLYTRRPENLYKAEDLGEFTASGGVLLDTCTADSLAQLMLDRAQKKR